eukprot:2731657-Alexandrium_andersonii.AAC.1
MSTPAAPKYWAPPRRRAWPPHLSAPEAVEMGSARSAAAAAMVATAAAFEITALEAVGKSGVATDAGSEAHTSSTCERTVHAGHNAAASTGDPPGRRQRAQ